MIALSLRLYYPVVGRKAAVEGHSAKSSLHCDNIQNGSDKLNGNSFSLSRPH